MAKKYKNWFVHGSLSFMSSKNKIPDSCWTFVIEIEIKHGDHKIVTVKHALKGTSI
jgi:hypothetical protein